MMDFPYHGFAKNLVDDLYPVNLFLKNKLQFLIAYSFSKNFHLYGERIGALHIICDSKKQA